MRDGVLLVFLVLFFFVSCDNISGVGREPDYEKIYFDYKITGEEDNDFVTLLLQFRAGGPNGRAIRLGEDVDLSVDGNPVPADSSKITGAFYEIQFPVSSFKGDHEIILRAKNKEYREPFHFQPVSLKNELPRSINRKDLKLQLEGVDQEDYIRVLLTDTVLQNDGINRLDTVRNGELVLTRAELQVLANGPIHLELMRENEKRIQNSSAKGGKISLYYRISREFMLVD